MAIRGDKLTDFVTATWYNAVTQTLGKKTGVRSLHEPQQFWYITVINHEAVPKKKWEAVSLGPAHLDYDSPLGLAHDAIMFDTADYDSADPDNLAILVEPLPGAIGQSAKALLVGVTWLRVPEALGPIPYIHIEDIEPSLIPGLAYSNSGRIEILRTFQFTSPPDPGAVFSFALGMFGPQGTIPGMPLGPSSVSESDPEPDTGYLGLAIIGKKVTRGIIDIRVSGMELQYTFDGVDWTTWHVGSDCTPLTS